MPAVYGCITAASFEWDTMQQVRRGTTLWSWQRPQRLTRWCACSYVCAWVCQRSRGQRLFLKAAAYGKNFIDTNDTAVHTTFVDVCKKLRVLNQLRDLSVRARGAAVGCLRMHPQASVL